jgi:hypothetical protein
MARVWEDDSAASGGREKYHVATEHVVHITGLVWLEENPSCVGTG